MRCFNVLAVAVTASAHIVITYPGTRGHNLITNETYPQGMQFVYPCGGLNVTNNRTYWPIDGGAVALEPGWQAGHKEGSIQINLGVGEDGPDGGPKNTSFRMSPRIEFTGPSNDQYDGTICMPRLGLPEDLDLQVGDNATIQVVEHTQHGASLYACVDIEFVESDDDRIKTVDDDNCFNSSNLEIQNSSEDEGDEEDRASATMMVNLLTVSMGLLASWAILG